MRNILATALLALASSAAIAQPGPVASPSSAHPIDPAAPVTLGQSVVALTGPWKFHVGDDPHWADPGFDDSAWQDYILDSHHPAPTLEQILHGGELPGWQQHEHPGYTGYAWYRIRLPLLKNAHSPGLLMPRFVEEAYEVYVNGRKIGGFGRLDGWRVTYPEQPELFSIPATALTDGQPVTLALRFWAYRNDALPSGKNLLGGLRGTPLVGSSELLRVFQQSVQQQTGHTAPHMILFTSACGAVGIFSLFLFFLSHSQREYLWAGISLTGLALVALATLVRQAQQTSIPFEVSFTAEFVPFCAAFFALPMAEMHLLCVPRPLWRRINYAVFAALVTWGLVPFGLALGLLPPSAFIDRISNADLVFYLPFVFLLLAITVDGLRSIGRKAWLPLTPGLLFAFYLLLFELFELKGRFVLLTEVVFVCVPLAVLVIFLLRFVEQQSENVRMVDDLKQAQEVQQVLLPEELPQIAGLTIQSEYHPAREVGGDFFQILPHPADGSVLIVIGDVTGKGLQAGMLVALIVGSIRTEAAHTSDPIQILNALNARLCGREHAQATCLVLGIESNGNATLANAGHLPPYLNGHPLDMAGALPLGMIDRAEFSVMRFHLSNTDRLVMMSDGIIEARNGKGELLGFDRVAALIRQPAAAIADAAQHWGQEDDITVLTVARISPAIV